MQTWGPICLFISLKHFVELFCKLIEFRKGKRGKEEVKGWDGEVGGREGCNFNHWVLDTLIHIVHVCYQCILYVCVIFSFNTMHRLRVTQVYKYHGCV